MCRDRFGHLAGKGFGNDGISCILHCLISSSSPASLCIAACLPLITSMHGPNSYGFDHMTAQSHDGELGGNERHIQLFPAISITRIIIGSVRQHDFSIAHSPCDLKLFGSSPELAHHVRVHREIRCADSVFTVPRHRRLTLSSDGRTGNEYLREIPRLEREHGIGSTWNSGESDEGGVPYVPVLPLKGVKNAKASNG